MGAVLDREEHGGLRGTFAFEIGDERFHVIVTDAGARVRQGAPPAPDVRAMADPMTFFALADRRLTPAKAVRDGLLTVEGDRRHLDALFKGFHLPDRVAA